MFAVFETLIAVAGYWYLVWHFNWHWMMFISMLAAPMLLLKSEQSVALGLRWLKAYWREDERSVSLLEKGLIIVLTSMMTGLICYWLAQQWLPGLQGRPLFWYFLGIAGIGISISLVCMIACSVEVTKGGVANIAVAVAVVAAITVARGGNFLVSLMLAGAIAIMFVLAGAHAWAGTRAIVRAPSGTLMEMFSRARTTVIVVPIALALPLLAIGILLRTLLIRLFATLRHPIAGLQQLPQNWRSSLWVIDPCHLPELLPKAGTIAANFSIVGLWSNYQSSNALTKLVKIGLTPFFYFPAMLYRWSLKASAWLWFPLVLVLLPPLYQRSRKATRKMLAIIPAWHLQYVAGATLVLIWMLLPWIGHVAHKFSPTFTDLASSLPTAPAFGVRMLIACTAALFTLLLVYRSTNFKASHGTVIESPNEFRQLDTEDEKEFMEEAKRIDRIRTCLIASIILWGYASVLGLAQQLYPAETARLVGPWLLAIL